MFVLVNYARITACSRISRFIHLKYSGAPRCKTINMFAKTDYAVDPCENVPSDIRFP